MRENAAKEERAGSEAAENELTEAEAAETETTETETVKAETTETEAAEAEITETETVKAETTETKTAETETAETEITEAETAETGTTDTRTLPTAAENPAAEDNSANRGYFLKGVAGLYLIYTAYELADSYLKKEEGSSLGFCVAGIIFGLIGVYLLYIVIRGYLRENRQKKAETMTQVKAPAAEASETRAKTSAAETSETGAKAPAAEAEIPGAEVNSVGETAQNVDNPRQM